MKGYWMPPMDPLLELEERLGITGHKDPVVREGDLGHLEHTMHELAHAVLLSLPFQRRNDLSALVAETVKMSGVDEADGETPFAAVNEVDTFAVESLVMEDLGIPIADAELVDGLAVQVSMVMGMADYPNRFAIAKETGHVRTAADKVRDLIAPDGRPPMPAYTCGTAALWRRVRNDYEVIVYPMMNGNARLCIGEPGQGDYFNAWCYQTDRYGSGLVKAVCGAAQWDGEGDDPPGGWIRNPVSGRRRPDGDPSKEYTLK